MKKILILTPIYKRPEILRIFLEGFQRVKKTYPSLILVCIISPEDKFYDTNLKMIMDAGGDVCEFKNKPLGEKKNAGLDFALREYDFDYFMDLGSDDLLNSKIFELYQPYMEGDLTFFGLDNLYIHDWYSKRTLFLKNYNGDHTFGAGRMLHRRAIDLPLWPDDAPDGLDTKMQRGLQAKDINDYIIKTGEVPYILDIKTNTNLSHFREVLNFKTKEVEFSDIAPHFGLKIYDKKIKGLQEFDNFEKIIDEFQEAGYNRQQAYDVAEGFYSMYYGKNKYKNYDTYSRIKRRYENKYNHTVR